MEEGGGEERGEAETCREITLAPFLVHFHQPPLDQYHFVFLPFFGVLCILHAKPLITGSAGRDLWMLHSAGCPLSFSRHLRVLKAASGDDRQPGNLAAK